MSVTNPSLKKSTIQKWHIINLEIRNINHGQVQMIPNRDKKLIYYCEKLNQGCLHKGWEQFKNAMNLININIEGKAEIINSRNWKNRKFKKALYHLNWAFCDWFYLIINQ